ncbi:heme-binding protein [Acinetobacter sp. RW6]|uniref:GlcG/HbpS family heme-binding protein n=1 Tax=Acinetobacter sp. RW6 TaxID=3242680 RepID=UPI0035BFD2DF
MKHIWAKKMISFGVDLASQQKLSFCFAIYDESANLLAFQRMDHSMLGSIDLALTKAKTACLFRTETQELGQLSQPNMPIWSIEFSNGGLSTIAGGVPLLNQAGEFIGSIGVSGGTAEQDKEMAQMCSEYFLKKLGFTQ